jgi:outer membrane receptor protein involved in Fe transport
MKNLYWLIAIIILFNFYNYNLYAQTEFQGERGGVIKGRIIDRETKQPVEYANVVLLTLKDSLIKNGAVSDVDGYFTIDKIIPGEYLLDVTFIGFDHEKFKVEINRQNRLIDLGDVLIHPATYSLTDVVVEGERSPVTYQIDKKVLDVGKMQNVISGNASDILQNVPSVNVDIEGNVSLRGSTSFTVLIDGRPSIISGQDALQQIPASSIDKIEIITNPSVKYNPEGTAGIINILLKKNQNVGLSGIINGNAGLNDKYGGDFLFEYKMPDITTTFGVDYNKRNFPGTSNEQRQFFNETSTTFINSNGTMKWGRISFGLRAAIEFKLNENNIISLGGRYGKRDGSRNSFLNYSRWTEADPQKLLYESNSFREHLGDFYASNLTYLIKFNSRGHELKAEFNYGYDDNNQTTTSQQFESGVQNAGKKTTESGPSNEFDGKLDYTLPLSETSKFEAGYEGEAELSEEKNELSEFNPQTNLYELQSLFSNDVKYNNSGHAFYTIYSDKIGNLGLQGGLRTEYTYRKIELVNGTGNFNIDRWDLFPSFHTSYEFSKGSQLMASYTRRIERPDGWQLEPFITWFDENNVRRGNPDLKPEFIDSYDAGVQTLIGRVSLSADLYYRVTNNKIEQVRSVYQDNVTLNSVDNVGTDYALGSEFMVIFDPFKFWNLNLMANVYNYKIKGVLNDENFERESFNWNTRFNSVFRLGQNTQLQLNLNYSSPTVSSQGRSEGSFSTDLSARQDFFDKQLALILQVRDLFKTAKYEFTSSGPDFYNYNYFKRESPVVMLTARFTFNNYKPKRERIENGNEMGEDF